MYRIGAAAACVVALAASSWAGEAGVIAGMVRDTSGAALEGVRITVTSAEAGAPGVSSLTAPDGTYRFASLKPGVYTVVAEGTRFARAERANVQPSPSGTAVDFTLAPATAGPKFEAAGIRGLIDPGGYSAPANSAAGSALMENMAELKRSGNASASATAAHPCSAAAMIAGHRFEDARRVLADMQGTEAHRMRAEADEGLGRFAEAAQEYESAAAVEPREENLFGAGYELILSGAAEPAAKVFESGLKQLPRSALLTIGLGIAQFFSGRSAEAVRTFLEAVAIAPSDRRPYAFLARAFEAGGVEPERVIAAVKTFAEAGPNDAEAQYDYAAVLLRQRTGNSSAGDLHRIQALLERAVALAPGLAQAHRELGAVYLEEKDYAGAIRAYEKAAQLLPGRCDIHYRLSMAYRLAMREDKADSERQVFTACRSQQKETAGEAGITVDQFVSVMRGARSSDAAAPSCDH